MVKAGIIGLGFMGKMHYGVYSASGKAEITAISDVDENKLKGDWSAIGGNIDDPDAGRVDLAGVIGYPRAEDLISDPEVELVDITLPTYMHEKYVRMALDEGKHVLCEKPIALDLKQADRMLEAAEKAAGKFMVAHCIRFWPEYEMLHKYIKTGKYGELYSINLGRFSSTPVWGWENWLQEGGKSGGAAVDLHVHDVDFLNWCFGMPGAVSSTGVTKTSGAVDSISALYTYESGIQASAQGGWICHPSFGLDMNYLAVFEKATVEFSSAKDPGFKVHTHTGRTLFPKLPAGDGYSREIGYFIDCIARNRKPDRVTPAEARDSLKIVLAEIDSVKKGRAVRLS